MDDKITIEDLELDPEMPVMTFGMGDEDISTIRVKDLTDDLRGVRGKPLTNEGNSK